MALELQTEGIEIPEPPYLLVLLLLADDVILMGESVPQIIRTCEIVTRWADKWGMLVGIKKCGLMVIGGGELREQVRTGQESIMLQGQVVPLVDQYDYLGVTLAAESLPKIPQHIAERVKKGVKQFNFLHPFLQSHSIPFWLRRHVLRVEI